MMLNSIWIWMSNWIGFPITERVEVLYQIEGMYLCVLWFGSVSFKQRWVLYRIEIPFKKEKMSNVFIIRCFDISIDHFEFWRKQYQAIVVQIWHHSYHISANVVTAIVGYVAIDEEGSLMLINFTANNVRIVKSLKRGSKVMMLKIDKSH